MSMCLIYISRSSLVVLIPIHFTFFILCLFFFFLVNFFLFFLFFFSSRRRHPRYWRDWSSDVCSSDLIVYEFFTRLQLIHPQIRALLLTDASSARMAEKFAMPCECSFLQRPFRADALADSLSRSEERRVGKECRSRLWPDHQKKNK